MKLINEEHFVSGSQDGYVALLGMLPSNQQAGYIITTGLYPTKWYIVTHLLFETLGSTRCGGVGKELTQGKD